MSTQPSAPVPSVRLIDRIFAFGALGLAAASVLCFLAIIIGTATGMDQSDFAVGAWPIIAAIPLWGLPLAFVMIISLLTMSFIRKGRAAKRP
ncbi:multidrug ABC transporter ATPase [Microbacterium sp. NIBRBAC000506063]|uniref:multidrug ABC transporter ATPase n=1 Tax=Microbacterium sp. NIBRBAC000506063 TaxID=2734618 RepID=UPI001BB578C3|nr:multidrug ABC transporter ATPase [Microbacterium sp. NIBRBAC000506063]QTV79999.1 multidrug ABC transporter ATPase [Microbacterium sp. NIBRBAC000506063]